MVISCDRCEARGLACGYCAATALVGEETDLGPAELRALTVLANAGLIPPLRYAPRMAKASLPVRPVINGIG
ncbi:MAG: hypothetical protein ACRDN1_00320 [Trebonia sp.]